MPAPTANALADAEWPDGNDVEAGMRAARVVQLAGTSVGRGREANGLMTAFVTADVTATDNNPRSAARRFFRPPRAASNAETAIQIFE